MENNSNILSNPQEFINYLNQESQKVLEMYSQTGHDDLFAAIQILVNVFELLLGVNGESQRQREILAALAMAPADFDMLRFRDSGPDEVDDDGFEIFAVLAEYLEWKSSGIFEQRQPGLGRFAIGH